MLLEAVGAILASDGQLTGAVKVAEGTESFNGQDVVAGDAVVEHHATHDFKVVRGQGQVA